MIWLKQSTAAVISFGPFVSPTDGVTLQTGLVSAIDNASTGIFLSKNGGALTIRHASVTASTYDAYGNYLVTLDATDTNALGSLRVQFAAAASCLPVWVDCMVLQATMWNSLFGTGGAIPNVAAGATNGLPLSVDSSGRVDVLKVNGTSQTAKDLGASATQTGDSYARLGAPAGASVSADVAAVKSDSGAVKTQTDKMAFTVANQIDANVLDWKSATAPAMTGDAYARLGAPAGASVSADIAAVKSETDTILTDVNTGGGAIYSRLGAPAGASIAADIAAVKVDSGAIKAKTDNLPAAPAAVSDIPTANANADALLDRANGIETGMTLRQALRGSTAMLFGKVSGGQSGTEVFRNAVADSKTRITMTDDSSGNRSAVSTDFT